MGCSFPPTHTAACEASPQGACIGPPASNAYSCNLPLQFNTHGCRRGLTTEQEGAGRIAYAARRQRHRCCCRRRCHRCRCPSQHHHCRHRRRRCCRCPTRRHNHRQSYPSHHRRRRRRRHRRRRRCRRRRRDRRQAVARRIGRRVARQGARRRALHLHLARREEVRRQARGPRGGRPRDRRGWPAGRTGDVHFGHGWAVPASRSRYRCRCRRGLAGGRLSGHHRRGYRSQ